MSDSDIGWQFMHYVYYDDHIMEAWHNYVTGEWEEREIYVS